MRHTVSVSKWLRISPKLTYAITTMYGCRCNIEIDIVSWKLSIVLLWNRSVCVLLRLDFDQSVGRRQIHGDLTADLQRCQPRLNQFVESILLLSVTAAVF